MAQPRTCRISFRLTCLLVQAVCRAMVVAVSNAPAAIAAAATSATACSASRRSFAVVEAAAVGVQGATSSLLQACKGVERAALGCNTRRQGRRFMPTGLLPPTPSYTQPVLQDQPMCSPCPKGNLPLKEHTLYRKHLNSHKQRGLRASAESAVPFHHLICLQPQPVPSHLTAVNVSLACKYARVPSR